MSVVIETTLGDITVDLFLDQRPITCLNFLKLCKMKYYNFNLFHSIRSGFIAQTGDPSGEGSGGESIWGLLDGPDKRFFSGEKMPKIRHTDAGLLSMVCTGEMMIGSQFFFTLGPDLDSLDSVHCVIGEVAEGHEVLRKLNDVICDESHRPYQDVRITHTVVLEDPFSDPPGLRAPSRSPSPSAERLKGGRIAPDEELDETQGKSAAEIQEMIEDKEAKARATILEIVGDLPDADIAPPENVLFVCKLNPVTTDEDLEIIFSRFGKIVSCEVIRDKKTGDSLQYAFIEFSDKKSCEDAYFKMDNVLIDDRRIHVDFSQSVSKMRWLGKGRGVQHFKDGDEKEAFIKREKSNRSKSEDRGDYKKHNRDRNEDSKMKSDRFSNNDHRHKSERNVSKSQRERSRSRSMHKSNKIDKKDHSHNESRSKDGGKSRKSDVDVNRENNSKTQSSNKTESSNKYDKNRSSSKYEEKSRNKNRDRSVNRYEHQSQEKRYHNSKQSTQKGLYSGEKELVDSEKIGDERLEKNYDNKQKSKSGNERINHMQNVKYDSRNKNKTEESFQGRSAEHEKSRHKDKHEKYEDNKKRSRSEPEYRVKKAHNNRNKQDENRHQNKYDDEYNDRKNPRYESSMRKGRNECYDVDKRRDTHTSKNNEKVKESNNEHIDARTPTPKETKRKEEQKKNAKLKKVPSNKKSNEKKKHKHSSSDSSDSDSSDTSDTSSTSGSSSSSSDEESKKKRKKRRKSSSSSDSSTSSSSDTSSSSSSSSDSDRKIKKTKKITKKQTENKSKGK